MLCAGWLQSRDCTHPCGQLCFPGLPSTGHWPFCPNTLIGAGTLGDLGITDSQGMSQPLQFVMADHVVCIDQPPCKPEL